MDERKRITAWLSNDMAWLLKEKVRIESAEGHHECEVVTHQDGDQALFYTGGYFSCGGWVDTPARAAA